MNNARRGEDKKMDLALVALILAFALYGQCVPARAAECNSGEIRVSAETGTTIQCVAGQWDALVTATESTLRSERATFKGLVVGILMGGVFGTLWNKTRRGA